MLTQWGINLDIGSGKLHSIQSAHEAVEKAVLSLDRAQKAAAQTGVVGAQAQVTAMLTEQKAATALAASHLSGSNAVANALEAQKVAQAEVESGQIKGASAVGALQKTQMTLTESIESGGLKRTAAALAYESAQNSVKNSTERNSYAQTAALDKVVAAQLTLKDAQLNYKQSSDAVSTVLSTLNERTKGAASLYGKTLPGQLKVLDAELHNLGTSFGEFLTPKLEEAGRDLGSVLGWFEKNSWAAKALAGVVGGVLTVAVGVFAEQKLVKLGQSLGKAVGDLHKLEQGAVSVGKRILGIGQPTGAAAPEEQVSTVGAASDASAGQVAGLGGAAEASAGQITGLGGASEAASGQITALGGASEEMATTISASATEAEVSLAAIGDAAQATADAETVAGAEGGEGIAAMLGPIGLVAFAALEIATHWKLVKEVAEDVWHFLDREVIQPMERGFDWLEGKVGVHLGSIGHYFGLVEAGAETAWHFIDNDVLHPLEAAFHWVEGEIKAHLHSIEGALELFGPLLLGPLAPLAELALHWKTVWNFVSGLVTTVVADLEKGWGRLESDVTGLWKTVSTDTTKGVTAVVGFVEALPGKLEGLFVDAGTWLLDAGENLLKGLVKGIGNEEKGVLKTADDFGKKVLHTLTHPWEVLSPSKKTAEAGGYLIQGISVGMKGERAALLNDADSISRSLVSEFAKVGGRDAGHQFMVDFASGISGNAHLAEFALASVMKDLTKSSTLRQAFASAMSGVTPGGHPVGPGSSLSNVFNFPNARIEANDPRQLGRQLEMVARRKNAVRT